MPLSLVVLALLGSVVIPARQTWVISDLLRETTELLAPARVLSAQLQSGLADEMGALQSYALSGDDSSARRHQAVVAENDRRLAELETVGTRLDDSLRSHIGVLHERVTRWRSLVHVPTDGADADRRELVKTLHAGQAALDASRAEAAQLSSALAAEASSRDLRVRELEHYGLISNVALVVAAFVALYAVLVLTLRERRLADSLQRVITSRSRLMRGFSHDVKNPIGAADGYAELLDEGVYGDLNPRQHESLARLRRCLRGALALIDDLHELGRAETGHLAITPEPVDVCELVRRLGEEYQATALAGGLHLDVDAEAGIPLIRTSRTRVRQIVSNLLSNAVKYTDAGSVTLSVVRRSETQGDGRGEWLLIEVADTGHGIRPDRLEYIFQEFGRADVSEKRGAGLGLAISRLLAQALGGRITVASEVGRGSTFTLWLPFVIDAEGVVTAGGAEQGER